jgi:hypothetical protein
MKAICTVLAVAAALFTLPATRAQTPSSLHFATSEWSFGDIEEQKGAVSHTFEFTNTAPTPVSIDRVASSCGCTTPDYPRTPIAAGAKAHITVTFDPTGYPGDFSKSVSVVSGGGRSRNFLTITGHVIPRPKSVEEEYPYDMGGGLRVNNTLLTFRSVAQGTAAAMAIDYINTSTSEITLALEPVKSETEDSSGVISTYIPETACAGCRGNITFTYDLTETDRKLYGTVHDLFRININGHPSSRTIYTTMTGIDDFAGVDADSAPRFFIERSFHDFGEVSRRPIPYTFRLTASNEGASELHIRSVSTSDEGVQCTLRGGMTIAPGASLPFEVILYGNRYPRGEIEGRISIVVDDPTRPTREIRIAADIK